jgi:hypothetical protein
MVAGLVVITLVLGACSVPPDQPGASTTTSLDQTVTTATTSSDQTVTTVASSESTDTEVQDTDLGVLPEPGSGLEHPKTPNTTKVVPPPQD